MRLNLRKFSKSKAFTLTELLVVVVIIGVLSAVALPKFNRVIETRRTGEAEEMLSAIRMEQEKRCTLDKPYAGTFEQVGDIVASAQVSENRAVTDNYIYNLNATGVSAGSIKKSYSLSIPSYADGRICCEGDYCLTLNKNYPACNTLPSGAGDPCASNVPSKPKECFAGGRPSSSQSCGGCGQQQTRNVSCDSTSGTWKTGSWSACAADPLCYGESSQSCGAGYTGTKTRTCTCGTWGPWSMAGCGACSAPAGEPSSQPCPAGQIGTLTRTWDSMICAWEEWAGQCTCDAPPRWGTEQSALPRWIYR